MNTTKPAIIGVFINVKGLYTLCEGPEIEGWEGGRVSGRSPQVLEGVGVA